MNSDEQRVRRMARRQGITLEKSRVDGTFQMHDTTCTYRLTADRPFGLAIGDCEAWLLERDPSTGRQNRDWNPILLQARGIVESYDTKVTLRQLFYRLVSREVLRNNVSDYNALSSKTAAARREGWFPRLVDQTSSIVEPRTFTSPSQAIGYMYDIYRRDRTAGQQVSIYLGVEKAGIKNQLEEWFGDLGVPILPLGGYSSQTYVDDIAEHAASQDRPAILIYAGDFDGSGEDIFRDLVDRTDCWAKALRIALTPEQIQRYDLPVLPGKETDTRALKHARRQGFDSAVQVEMDALDPAVLRGLYRDAIDEYWDADAYAAAVAAEESDLAELSAVIPDDQ